MRKRWFIFGALTMLVVLATAAFVQDELANIDIDVNPAQDDEPAF